MNTKLCVTYLRVSTEDQKTEQTIKTQRDAIVEFCGSNGFIIDKEFTDEARSGALPIESREGLSSLFVYLEENTHIKNVVIYDVSRIARDLFVAITAKRRAQSAGVEFHYVRMPKSGNEQMDNMQENMYAMFAEFERQLISTRTMAGRLRKARNEGKVYMHKHITLGYNMKNGKLVMNPKEAKIVRFIFESYLKGYSTDKIGLMLAEKNMYSKTFNTWKETDDCMPELVGKAKWQRGSVAFILHNPTYMGIFEYKQKGHNPVLIKVPPIVTEWEFDTAQKKLKLGLEQSPRTRKHKYAYKGIIKCGVCGRPFHCVSSTYKGKTYANYRCASVNTPEVKSCGNRSITEGKLDSVIFPLLKEKWEFTKTASFKRIYKELNSENKEAQEDIMNKQTEIRKEIDALDNKTKKLVELYAEDQLDKDMLKSKIEEINKERERLDKEIARLETIRVEWGRTLTKPETDFLKNLMKRAEENTRKMFAQPDKWFREMQLMAYGDIEEIVVNKDTLTINGNIVKTNQQSQISHGKFKQHKTGQIRLVRF